MLIAGKDDEMFMTRSLNVTPKTTEQRIGRDGPFPLILGVGRFGPYSEVVGGLNAARRLCMGGSRGTLRTNHKKPTEVR